MKTETEVKAPALCESCRHAYVMPGGMVMIGNEIFEQKYCTQYNGSISNPTIQKCDKYFGVEQA